MSWYAGNRGHMRIDRRYKGVGRIQRSSGVSNLKDYDSIVDCMDQLFKMGRIDVLIAIRDKVLSPIEVWHKHKLGDTKSFKGPADLKMLNSEDETTSPLHIWLNSINLAATTKRGYAACIDAFHKFCNSTSSVGELPAILETMRKKYEKEGKARTFNQTRSMLQSYTRSTFKRHSQLWLAISAIEPLPVKMVRKHNPVTVKQALEMMQYMKAEVGKMFWGMCISGMNPKEFYIDGWEMKADRILIHGDKRESRERIIPLFGEVVAPALTYKHYLTALRIAARKANIGKFTPLDTRRTFAVWIEEAGIIDSRRMHYRGHKPKTMGQLYAQKEPTAEMLKEDAAKFKAYLDISKSRQDGL